MGLSGSRGRLVITLHKRSLGPNSGVISRPFLPNRPKPASIANGMLKAVSFPSGIA